MVDNYEQLQNLSYEEILRKMDSIGPIRDLDFFRSELWLRDAEEVSERMLGMTSNIERLTVFVAALTIVNVAVFIYSVFAP